MQERALSIAVLPHDWCVFAKTLAMRPERGDAALEALHQSGLCDATNRPFHRLLGGDGPADQHMIDARHGTARREDFGYDFSAAPYTNPANNFYSSNRS